MVDLTPDEDGKPKARLLDLVPGRSGKAYSDWLEERGEGFKDGVEVATLDPFHGYKNAIDDQLEDAIAVLDDSTATRTPSTTSSRTPSPSSTPSTSSSSAPRPSTKSDAACSKRSTATAAARTTRSTGSG